MRLAAPASSNAGRGRRAGRRSRGGDVLQLPPKRYLLRRCCRHPEARPSKCRPRAPAALRSTRRRQRRCCAKGWRPRGSLRCRRRAKGWRPRAPSRRDGCRRGRGCPNLRPLGTLPAARYSTLAGSFPSSELGLSFSRTVGHLSRRHAKAPMVFSPTLPTVHLDFQSRLNRCMAFLILAGRAVYKGLFNIIFNII